MIPSRALALSAILVALTHATAFGQSAPQWYVGGAIGRLHIDTDYTTQVGNTRIPDDRGAIHDVRVDLQDKLGGRVFGGFRLTPRFSFELDYVNLGKVAQAYTIPGQPLSIFLGDRTVVLGQDQFLREGRSRMDGYGLSAVGAWPLGERFSLVGRAGAARTRLRYEEVGTFLHAVVDGTTNPPTARISAVPSPRGTYADLKQTRPVLGLGVDYRLTDRVNLRGEWARYFGIGRNFERDVGSLSTSKGKFDVDLISLGASFSF